jgi:uncharacterized protein YdhG (YjbR/CyaY superfamily)
MSKSANPTTAKDVDKYLSKLPKASRAALEELRRTIKSIAPEASECISYQIPTFKYRGRMLVSYAAFKDHCSFFPGAGPIELHAKELASYTTSKGTVQFTPDRPLPASTIKKLVRTRMQLDEAKSKTR